MMPPTEQDLKLLGVAPERITAALKAWEQHPWYATPERCKCGLKFEASLKGHELHATHRMAVTLKAGEPEAHLTAVEQLGFFLEKRTPRKIWVIQEANGEGCRPAQISEIRLWKMLIETIEKLQESSGAEQSPPPAEGHCTNCGAERELDSKRIASLKVFCPNDACDEYLKSFWIDR